MNPPWETLQKIKLREEPGRLPQLDTDALERPADAAPCGWFIAVSEGDFVALNGPYWDVETLADHWMTLNVVRHFNNAVGGQVHLNVIPVEGITAAP